MCIGHYAGPENGRGHGASIRSDSVLPSALSIGARLHRKRVSILKLVQFLTQYCVFNFIMGNKTIYFNDFI